jgi:hypothetical protein
VVHRRSLKFRTQAQTVFRSIWRRGSRDFTRDWLRKRTLGHHRNKMTVRAQYAKELRYSNTTYTNKPMDTRLPSLCDPLFLCTTVILHSKPRMSRNYNDFMFAQKILTTRYFSISIFLRRLA